MASSHGFAIRDPSEWDANRERTRRTYASRYGAPPPEHPRVAEETEDDIRTRHANITAALAYQRRGLDEIRPDALVFVGNDQNENFTDMSLPQVAIYVGSEFLATDRGSTTEPLRYRCETELASAILSECVECDIDMTFLRTLPEGKLVAHAFGPMLRRMDPDARMPVVPVFVNTHNLPAPSPARCFYYGQAIRRAVERYAGARTVAIYASGGLSHFTSGYPYEHYEGPFSFGAIAEDFDRWLVERMAAGDGAALAEITSKDLMDNGDIETRSWITLLGAIGDVRPELIVYEPFYRGLMGLGVAYWNLTK